MEYSIDWSSWLDGDTTEDTTDGSLSSSFSYAYEVMRLQAQQQSIQAEMLRSMRSEVSEYFTKKEPKRHKKQDLLNLNK